MDLQVVALSGDLCGAFEVAHAKHEELGRILRDMRTVLVAFSGGVDSTFVLRVAVDTIGDQVVALTTRSPNAVDDDYELAAQLATAFVVRHDVIDSTRL